MYLLNRVGSSSPNTPASGVATGVPYAITSTIDDGEGHYFLGINMCQNPTDPKTIVALVGEGGDHVYAADKHVTMYKSVDFCITWDAKSTAYDPAGVEATQGNSAGYDSNGRLHLFVTIVDQTLVAPVHDIAMRYLYSDDDGTTWSTAVDLTRPSDSLYAWRNIDAVIENNGVLLSPYYALSTEGDITASARYVLRSTDYGATWTHILVEAQTAAYINESSIVALDATRLLMLSRVETSHKFQQYISSDNGLTWTNQGVPSSFPVAPTISAPPILRRFDINGTRVIVCYYTHKDTYKINVIYATAENLIASGLTGWAASTLATVTTNTTILHYGDVCHVNNNFNSYAMYSKERNPYLQTHNAMIHQTIQSTNYATVKTALGIA